MTQFLRRFAEILLLLPLLLLTMPAFSAAPTISAMSPATVNAVLELYTSEGCSSCPPADRWLSSLKPQIGKKLRVVPLAFHVDYWNYLGWEDAYSSPLFTARQRELGELNRQRTIYTPEFFVDSREKRGGGKILAEIKQNNRKTSTWTLQLDIGLADERTLEVTVGAQAVAGQKHDAAEFFIALYENNIQREIKRGENSGKYLDHDFVVRDWIGPIEVSESNDRLHRQRIRLPADAEKQNTGLAIVLKDKNTGQNLQALGTDLHELFVASGD